MNRRPPTGNIPAPPGLRVLVVEDNAGDRWFFSEILRARGHTVISCETGESAWEAFKDDPTDLVIVDFMLPGLTGVDLCRLIRQHPRGHLPVLLAATGRDEPEALQAMLDAGADDFVRKPVDPELLNIRLIIAERRVEDRAEGEGTRSALRAKTRELETLFRNVREVFFSVDLVSSRLIQVSQQAETLFGVSPERLLSEPDLWKSFFRVGVEWDDVASSPPDSPIIHEYPVPEPEGAPPKTWVRASVVVERDPVSGGFRADGVVADNTAETQARMDAAQKAEELAALHRLSELTLAAPSLEEAYEAFLSHVCTVLDVPFAAIKQLDTERDRMVMVAARGMALPEEEPVQMPLHQAISREAVETGQPVIVPELPAGIEREVGYLRGLSLTGYAVFPLRAGGDIRGSLLVGTQAKGVFDGRFERMGVTLATAIASYLERLEAVTAVRESEARFRALAGQLQQANQELESFAYSVSHDLRAPLRTMQGFAHALLQNFGSQLDPEARDYANRIITSGKQSEELISDLLAYSRMSFERVELQPVALKSVVAAALEQVQGDLQETGARVEVTGRLPVVLGNHTTLVQVVTNLVSNAVKFVEEGMTPEVQIFAEEVGERARLTVKDNGIGIPEGQEERIFRVFERLTEGSKEPGTGIGLAIVRRGMQRIGGTCGVDARPEGGSAFWIEVPREHRSPRRPWSRRAS